MTLAKKLFLVKGIAANCADHNQPDAAMYPFACLETHDTGRDVQCSFIAHTLQ